MALPFVESLPQNNSRVMQTAIKALELLLLSAGLISTILMVKGAVMPFSCEIVFSNLVGFWNSIKCFLSSPLYICIIINFMVVLIAASSTFYPHETDVHDCHNKDNVDGNDILIAESPLHSPPPLLLMDVGKIAPRPPQRDITGIKKCSKVIASQTCHDDSTHCIEKANLSSTAASFSNGSLISEAHEIEKTEDSIYLPPDLLLSEYIEEKRLFLEMDAEVSNNQSDDKENEEDDTMEATWKAITGQGKQRPKRKQMKKSETWNVAHVPPTSTAPVLLPSTPRLKELRKSETFNNTVSITHRGGLRRDPSVSLDKFNKQVEAFIKKFNDNMRLQRQESDQRFLDMINRGL